ncbi:MAG: hypothetical protein ACOYO1_06630 [Bacteroidales bacterium]
MIIFRILKVLIISIVISAIVGFIASIIFEVGGGSNYGQVQKLGMHRIEEMSTNLGIVVSIITFIVLSYKWFGTIFNKK